MTIDHAELERRRGGDPGRTVRRLADLRARLRDDCRTERRIGGDDRAGGDRRQPRGAAHGTGPHPLHRDRRRTRDAVSRAAHRRGRLGGRPARRSRRRAGAGRLQQHLQARGHRRLLSVARFLRATSSFASPERVAIRRSAVSTRPLSRRAERSRSRLPGGRSWRSRGTPSKRSAPGSPARPSSTTPPREAVQHIENFLESLPLETIDLGTIAPRLVRLCHALDHLAQLHDDLGRALPAVSDWQPPAGFAGGRSSARRVARRHERPRGNVDPAIYQALEAASKQLGAERDTGRAQLLEDVALQRMPAAAARAGLDTLAWADGALYHAWRLAESLELASSKGTLSAPR